MVDGHFSVVAEQTNLFLIIAALIGLAWLDNVSGYSHPSGQIHQTSNPTMMHVDSPSTTSATTYAIFWARAGGSGNIHFNNYLGANNQTRSWFTVEEIAQ